ncbi:hypothetical protein BFP97_05515 [Roseivirga sp. 4D4]|uniref:hypothetical protein n=1 Tax=Roseivirga sp. 4D4 TaxID=1889784 RepID=UPI000852A4CC|nr:hypothetical protein [Roseivirga sp. 4D4]OEK01001.1 hypothetical protein BFP97_05515 [Roseivirga sp. 4D4]
MRNIAIHTTDFSALGMLTTILATLCFFATVLGLVNNDLYMDGEWVNAQWLGQDFMTLVAAIPTLVYSSWMAIRKRSLKWELVLGGTLFYLVYVYTFYVFDATFTLLYFLHLPIFSISLLCLFVVFHHMLNARNDYAYRNRFSLYLIIVFLLMIAVMLGSLWMRDLVNHLIVPDYFSETPDGQPPLVIYSLDLGIIIPMMVIAALLLFQNHSLGLIMTGVMLVMTALIGFALMAMSASLYFKGLHPSTLLILLWSLIGLAGFLLSIVYLRRLEVFPRMVDQTDLK